MAIPGGVASIGDRAFADCKDLAYIDIPSGVASIGKEAFYGCADLTSVTIPGSAADIGSGAFSVSSLASVIILNPVPPAIGGGRESPFANVNTAACTLYVPAVGAYSSADGWTEFKNISSIEARKAASAQAVSQAAPAKPAPARPEPEEQPRPDPGLYAGDVYKGNMGLQEAVGWMMFDVRNGSSYTIVLGKDEAVSPVSLDFKNLRVSVALKSAGAERRVRYQGHPSRPLFTVGRGVTFVLEDGVILAGLRKDSKPLVGVEEGGVFVMNGGAISGNASDGSGGGVFIGKGVFTMNGGVIGGNKAADYGGGVFGESGSVFIKPGSGGVIYGADANANATGAGAGAASQAQANRAGSGGHAVFVRGAGKRDLTTGGTHAMEMGAAVAESAAD
jgi:hypothetical protein